MRVGDWWEGQATVTRGHPAGFWVEQTPMGKVPEEKSLQKRYRLDTVALP